SFYRSARYEALGHPTLTGGRGIPRIAVSGWRRSASDGSPVRYFLESNMKTIFTATIFSAALVLGNCGLAVAQGEKADPVGTWQCNYEIGGQKRTSTLTINKDGDKLAGTMNWPDQKDEKIKDPKFKDGKLTVSAERKVMGNHI